MKKAEIELVGCILVFLAFILVRFVSPHQTKIDDRFVKVSWLGSLIVGLILTFRSDIRLGFIAFGCFLWLYYHSLGDRYTRAMFARFYGVPILANPIAKTLGFVLLLTGQVLLFFNSILYGFISIVAVFVAVQVLEYLRRIEWKLIEKEVSKDSDCQTPDKEVDVYIKGDFLSRMSKKETIIFYQILRITNNLEFWLQLRSIIPKEQNNMLELRNRIELYFTMISFYKESTKEFSRNLVKGLLDMNLSEGLRLKVSEYNAWLENWEQDKYLQVVHRIRNDLRFHMDSSIYDKYIKEGNESEDCPVGVAIGEQHKDFFYTKPYLFEIDHVGEIVPANTREEIMNWIQKRSVEEISKFIRLLRKISHEILKGNAYKKILDS